MEVSRSDIRLIVETCRRNDMTATDTHKFVTKAWGNASISVQSVYRLFTEFASRNRTFFEDKERQGRPRTSRTDENIELLSELLNEDIHVSIDSLVECTGLSHGTIYRILTDDLKKRSVLSRWVPHNLNKNQKNERVTQARHLLDFFQQHNRLIKSNLVITDEKWIYHRAIGTKRSNCAWLDENKARPRIVKRLPHEAKSLLLLAVCFNGKFCFTVLPQGATVDGECYLAFLKKTRNNFVRLTSPLHWNDMFLLHDNARPHVKQSVTAYLTKKGVTLLKQPPYSPDFNLCDRWIFTMLENERRMRNFENSENVSDFVKHFMKNINAEHLTKEFHNLKTDLRTIIENGGDYL